MFTHDEKKPPPEYSGPPPQPQASTSTGRSAIVTCYACVLLSKRDRIRILGFPQHVIQPLDEAITRVWHSGIQNRGPYQGGGYEWKLSGHPWSGQGHEAVPSRRLICHVLHALQQSGWQLSFASDLSKKSFDKDTLFFKPGPPIQRYFFSVSFNEQDKVRLIDSPNAAVTDGFISAVNTWPLGIQRQQEKEPGCYQMKLKGSPWWTSNGAQVNHARFLACALLGTLESYGYDFVGSIDMSVGSSEENNDLDSWFFGERIQH